MIRFTLRRFMRGMGAGDYRTLLVALIVTVAALTAVGLFTTRMSHLLNTQANDLLAADAVLSADHPTPAAAQKSAEAAGLQVAHLSTFPSMVSANGKASLSTIKTVTRGYPLRGQVLLQTGQGDAPATNIPAPGQVWLDARLAANLQVRPGSRIQLGTQTFDVAAIISREPDLALNFSGLQPSLLLNQQDLAQTGLIGFGSRVRYSLLVAGDTDVVQQWKHATRKTLERGERLEDVRESRPEVKVTLERSEDFLRLVSLLAAALAGAAVLLAARRHALRQTDAVALFVALGASRRTVAAMLWIELLALWVLSAVLGGLIGWAAQAGLAWVVHDRLPAPLPPGDIMQWLAAAGPGWHSAFGHGGPGFVATGQNAAAACIEARR